MSAKYKILGFNEEICECDVCGKSELKGTYVMLDLETDVIFRAGSTCGAKIAKWTNKEFTSKVKQLKEENILLAKKEINNSIESINYDNALQYCNNQNESVFSFENRMSYLKPFKEALRLKEIEIKNKYSLL